MTEAVGCRHHAIGALSLRAMKVGPVPVIAAVNGVAMGGGNEIALDCDFIHVVDHARFAFAEVTRGIMPGVAGPRNRPGGRRVPGEGGTRSGDAVRFRDRRLGRDDGDRWEGCAFHEERKPVFKVR